MKIVIDIPEEEIKSCQKYFNGDDCIIHNAVIYSAIIKGVHEREKGEWIAYDHGMGLVYLKCPFCESTIDKRYVEHNFCGKCGAELSGEKSGFERA